MHSQIYADIPDQVLAGVYYYKPYLQSLNDC